ncbi:MAG: transglutaminase domain-containing protein [Acidobacteriia bacterium]|nr:transglutaminase domain-containing protein [Terriglobia bacterium]
MRSIPLRCVLAPLACQLAALALPPSDAAPQPRTRRFHFEYKAIVKGIPPGAKQVDLWVPVPHDDAWQQIKNLRVDSPYAHEIATASHGNAMLHVRLEEPKESTFTVAMTFDAARTEHIQSRLAGGPAPARDQDPKELAQYLQPDRLVPLDGQIRAWARDVVQKADAHTDLEMARAIYHHVISTVKYDKTGKGWGRGDIYYACQERRGNCTDFHAIFIGYARAVGIPARFAIGFPLPADRGEGKIAGYHCWAEFYAKGIGWVPIDASEAAKNPSKRAYFFGAHDENRVEFSKGRDVVLTPRQQGDALNYFVYPYAEVDGKPHAETAWEVAYRDTDAQPAAAVGFPTHRGDAENRGDRAEQQ